MTVQDTEAEILAILQRGIEPSTNGHHPNSEPGRFRRWTVPELLNADLTYQWDAVGMLVRPTYGVDTGELKTLKSYFGMSRQIGLAAGVPILGRWEVPERRRVLCYIAEGGRIPYTRRLIRLCEAHNVDPATLDGWLEPIFDAGPLDSDRFRDTLKNHLIDYQPAYVHLDPLYPFQPMTVNSSQLSQVGLMLNEVQAICADHDATFWITAHMNQTGQGFDLKRITGAGIGEWGDSWVLLRHRLNADPDRGKFYLSAEIGSRQWGGGVYDIDLDIGHLDPDSGTHDGTITFKVAPAGSGEDSDKDAGKRVEARRAITKTMKRARTPHTREEIKERTTGVSRNHIAAEIAVMIDQGFLIEHGIRKPDSGGRDAPMYRLSEEYDSD